jgi:thiamine kinase-like enzyme
MSRGLEALRQCLLEDPAQPGADDICARLPELCPDVFAPGAHVEALRLKSRVVRVTTRLDEHLASVVVKCLPRACAERNALVITGWLPRIGMADAAPRLLGTIRSDTSDWQVYEDLGTTVLDAAHPRPDVVAALVELITRLHTRAAVSPLLAEWRPQLADFGIRYFASNISEALARLDDLSAIEARFTAAERTVRQRLVERLQALLHSLPSRAGVMEECGGPETLLHGDLWTVNAVVTSGLDGPRARLIDWDRVGVGPVSYDLSTFLYRFPAVERPWILKQYRCAVGRAGWHLPDDAELNVLFETAECARYANRVIWPAMGLMTATAESGHWELAEILAWFDALQPVIPL